MLFVPSRRFARRPWLSPSFGVFLADQKVLHKKLLSFAGILIYSVKKCVPKILLAKFKLRHYRKVLGQALGS